MTADKRSLKSLRKVATHFLNTYEKGFLKTAFDVSRATPNLLPGKIAVRLPPKKLRRARADSVLHFAIAYCHFLIFTNKANFPELAHACDSFQKMTSHRRHRWTGLVKSILGGETDRRVIANCRRSFALHRNRRVTPHDIVKGLSPYGKTLSAMLAAKLKTKGLTARTGHTRVRTLGKKLTTKSFGIYLAQGNASGDPKAIEVLDIGKSRGAALALWKIVERAISASDDSADEEKRRGPIPDFDDPTAW